jgi:FixJ family two-component response regulator
MLLDLQMPGMTGIELQNELAQLNVQFPIVFMSGNAQQSDIIDAWQGGAVDFLLKPFTASQVSSKLARTLDTRAFNNNTQNTNAKTKVLIDIPISKREAQVLLLLGQGCQQFEVAQSLGLSLRTVKMYRTSLKNKLNLNTLMELARFHDEHYREILKIAGDD